MLTGSVGTTMLVALFEGDLVAAARLVFLVVHGGRGGLLHGARDVEAGLRSERGGRKGEEGWQVRDPDE